MSTTGRTLDDGRAQAVWDLEDTRAHPSPRSNPMTAPPAPSRRTGSLGCIAGILALIAALVPGLPDAPRWALVVGLGVGAVVGGASVLRRRQVLRVAMRAVAGLVLTAAAVAAAVLVPHAAPAVENRLLPPGSPFSTSATVRSSAELERFPLAQRDLATGAAAAIALHLRAMHGVGGPYPTDLQAANGQLIEQVGAIGDVVVGAIPTGLHVRYSVAPDQRFFEVRVAVDGDDASAATADSTLDVPEGAQP